MRAVISVSNNIAEGYERGSRKDFMRFLYISKGSCGEVRNMLYLAKDKRYITEEQFETLSKSCVNISVKLSNFITAIIKQL